MVQYQIGNKRVVGKEKGAAAAAVAVGDDQNVKTITQQSHHEAKSSHYVSSV